MTAREVALVHAGSRGLGFASALALVQQGFAVGITGRDESAGRAAASQLSEHGSAMAVAADVSDPDSLMAAHEQVERELGTIGVVVANAGGPKPGWFDQMEPSDWEAAFRLTLMSAVHAIRAALPGMRELGRGRIVMIGSSSIRKPIAGLVLSNTFRPALNGLVKDLAAQLAPESITVNLVAPGRIGTQRVQRLDEAAAARDGLTLDQVRARSQAAIPAGRYGRPEEFGALVAFLASRQASYITGQSILVDGGLVSTLP
jgi:3-oxoacyl-[acyl-carrier protein] reductase